jgi:pantothenate kinase
MRVVDVATSAELNSILAAELAALRRQLEGRVLIGIVGCPGVGKSTVSAALLAGLGPAAQVVAMDGFHLSNGALAELGRSDRKGAADTFDRDGFRVLLDRLRADDDDSTVWAPVFHREIEESFAADRGVSPSHRTVVVEGNYLLHWPECAATLDACWYLEAADDGDRVERLIERHMSFGRSRSDATAWVRDSDEVNALLIASTRDRADLVIRMTTW